MLICPHCDRELGPEHDAKACVELPDFWHDHVRTPGKWMDGRIIHRLIEKDREH